MKAVLGKFTAFCLLVAAMVMVSVPAHADVAAMQTAAESAITTAEGAVGAILVAGLVITVALWSYAKIKAAIRRN